MITDTSAVRGRIACFLKQPISRLSDDVVLTDLVADSFLLVDMVIDLQEELGVTLVHEDLRGVKTVGELVQLFAACSGQTSAKPPAQSHCQCASGQSPN